MKREKTEVYIRCIGFVLCLAVVLRLLSAWMNPGSLGMEDQVDERDVGFVNACNEKEHTIDVVIMGNSECLTLISTARLWNEQGITSCIAGKSGAIVTETYYNLKELYKTQNPKLLILETDGSLDPISHVFVGYTLLKDVGNYVLPIFQYHGLWEKMIEPTFTEKKDFHGFYVRDVTTAANPGDYMAGTGEGSSLPLCNKIYLDKIRELCQEHGTELLLVSAPSSLNCNYDTHMQMEKYAKETGSEFLDLNLMIEELGIDWTQDTLDGGEHINYSGTMLVTDFLIAYMNRYNLPDHREDPDYADWQQEYEQFVEENPLAKEENK